MVLLKYLLGLLQFGCRVSECRLQLTIFLSEQLDVAIIAAALAAIPEFSECFHHSFMLIAPHELLQGVQTDKAATKVAHLGHHLAG